MFYSSRTEKITAGWAPLGDAATYAFLRTIKKEGEAEIEWSGSAYMVYKEPDWTIRMIAVHTRDFRVTEDGIEFEERRLKPPPSKSVPKKDPKE